MSSNDQLNVLLEILKSGYWYNRKVTDVLKPFGISHEQYNVLRILEYGYPETYSLKKIQKKLMNQTANTTRLVEKLKVKGYLTSAYSKSNRRTLEIKLTQSGQTLLNAMRIPLMEMYDRVTEHVNADESKMLLVALRKIRKSI